MTDHTASPGERPLRRQLDILVIAAGLILEPYDPDLLDAPASWAVMDDIERKRPLDVAIGAAGLVAALAHDLAHERGELPEDVLRRLALHTARAVLATDNQ